MEKSDHVNEIDVDSGVGIDSSELVRSCGSILFEARNKQKKPIESIAKTLNLSVDQIMALELDKSEGLPEATYVRGYIRAYAKLLGLSVEEVLQSYHGRNSQKFTSLADVSEKLTKVDSYKKKKLIPIKPILVLLIIAVIFLWVSGFLPNMLNSSKLITKATTQNIVPGEFPVEGVGETQKVDDNIVPEKTDSASKAHTLILRFSDTSWVDIRDESGMRLAYKSYAEGEDLTVNSDTPMKVFITNASSVSVEYNGAAYDISQYQEGIYAKFEIGKENVESND